MGLVGLIIGGAAVLVAVVWLARLVVGWARGTPRLRVKLTIAFPRFEGRLGDRHLAITTRNVGRSPATVTRWWLRLPDGCRLCDLETAEWSDRVPATIPGRSSVAWFLPVDELASVVDDGELKRAYAVVALESGKTVRCHQRIPVRDLIA